MANFRGEIILYKPNYPQSHEVHRAMPETGDQSRYADGLKVGLVALLVVLALGFLVAWLLGVPLMEPSSVY